MPPQHKLYGEAKRPERISFGCISVQGVGLFLALKRYSPLMIAGLVDITIPPFEPLDVSNLAVFDPMTLP